MPFNVQVTRDSGVLHYDASVSGYDADFWATVSGTPAAASSKLRLNAATTVMVQGIKNADVELLLNVPTAPTSGDARTFGLRGVSLGNRGRCEFQISGTAFTAEVYDATGTLISTTPINWSSAWTAVETRYQIKIGERNVFFLIGGTIVAKAEDENLSKLSLPVRLSNSNSDNMDLGQLSIT